MNIFLNRTKVIIIISICIGIPFFGLFSLNKIALAAKINTKQHENIPNSPTDTCMVNSVADSGVGTLRDCINNALTSDSIVFDSGVFPPSSPITITLLSELPDIVVDGLIIDASNAGVILDGNLLSLGTEDGFHIFGASNVSILGLQIINFPDNGIIISGGSTFAAIGGNQNLGNAPLGQGNLINGNGNSGIYIHDSATMSNTILGNLIGTNISGTESISNTYGIAISGNSSFNTIGGTSDGEGNLISGNELWGVVISGYASNNKVIGNLIGTDFNGEGAIGNDIGIAIWGEATYNQIGGSAIGERNIISGNTGNGIQFSDSGTDSNTIIGNFIGTDINGTAALGNNESGVAFTGGSYNDVGGNTPEERNIISGNGYPGITLIYSSTTRNKIIGNYIGTDLSGSIAIPNNYGVAIYLGAQYNNVGGAGQEGNLISGNSNSGIFIYDPGTTGNEIVGNYIGTDSSGNIGLGNESVGIWLWDNAHGNLITDNLVSNNGDSGIKLSNIFSTTISNNFIGTNSTGTFVLPNTNDGIALTDNSSLNVINNNLVSGNNWAGICLNNASNNTINGNLIGTNHSGTESLGNSGNGIQLFYNSTQNNIDENLISGNGNNGIEIQTDNNEITNNKIGMDNLGNVGIPNAGDGLLVMTATLNTVQSNYISGNGDNGIEFINTFSNTISNNFIGTNISGTLILSNTNNGVALRENSVQNFVEGNLISGNGHAGIYISNSISNTILSNFLGTDYSGITPLGNEVNGVELTIGSSDNKIDNNLISGNEHNGIGMYGIGSMNNLVIRNMIGTNLVGDSAIPNASSGINIWGPSNNFIGSDTLDERNLISGNGINGIQVGGGASNNEISNNHIGTDYSGNVAIPNGNDGITIMVGAKSNNVSGNLISGNIDDGITIGDVGTDGNLIFDNYIGTDTTGSSPIPNNNDGIYIWNGAQGTVIGPNNQIGFNDSDGISIDGSTTLTNTITMNSIFGNDGKGIYLLNNSNQNVLTPTILTATSYSVSGSAFPNAIIEIFSDDENEGRKYEEKTQASPIDGSWTLNFPGGFLGPFLTATATDSNGNTSEFSNQFPIPPITGNWTALIYLNGDNNLDSWTWLLFNRLEMAVNMNPSLPIIVLWDRSGTGDTVLYQVLPDPNRYVLADYEEGVNMWQRGELNMGDPQTLINFVTDSRDDFPSEYTFLSIVDHGNGWAPGLAPGPMGYTHSGMSFDDTSGGAYLSTSNLELAFGVITNDGADPIDVVFYDACLMSMIENLYPLREFVHYLIASENESFSSYPYDQYLSSLNELTHPSELASSIVDIYYESLYGYPRTIAAYDLSKIQSVAEAVSNLAVALGDVLSTHSNEIQTSFDSSQKFDSNVDLKLTNEDGYVDLYHFSQLIYQNIPLSTVRSAAQGVMDAIGVEGVGVVLKERHMSGIYWDQYWYLSQAHGLSIYLPLGEEDWMLDYYNNTELTFAFDTEWNEFVVNLVETVQPPDEPEPDPVDPDDRPGPLDPTYKVYLPIVLNSDVGN